MYTRNRYNTVIMLYIVATPIGNLKDITLRAIETLSTVDGIICEDTRRASILLNHYNIKKPLYVLNDFSEYRIIPSLVDKLNQGMQLALISDAGTPLVSDPGYKLVRECIQANIDIDSIPGPSSVVTALTLSGLPPDKFFFLGYLPEKPGHRQALFNKIVSVNNIIRTTYIIFVAPHKLIKTLQEMLVILGDIEVVLAKELTKIHQRVDKKTINQWLAEIKNPKGEFVLLLNIDPLTPSELHKVLTMSENDPSLS